MSSLVVSRKQRHGIVAATMTALVALVVIIGSSGGGGLSSTEGSALPAARFELFDGGEATLADFSGKPLVINFWASWCPACVAELPDLQAVHEAFGDDVTILGVANTDRRGPALALADDVGLTYTLADDPNGDLFRALQLFAMPSTVFVTADGEISEVFGGTLDEDGFISRIEALGAQS